jgi:hypothetical protein
MTREGMKKEVPERDSVKEKFLKIVKWVRGRTLIEKLIYTCGISTIITIWFLENNMLYKSDGIQYVWRGGKYVQELSPVQWDPTDIALALGIVCVFLLIIFGGKKE